ncbi:MAG: hypothetical protein ACK5RL_15385 [Acidimicrobiales bacterium]
MTSATNPETNPESPTAATGRAGPAGGAEPAVGVEPSGPTPGEPVGHAVRPPVELAPLAGELSSVRFATVARRLGETARSEGLAPPAFRSPPRSGGTSRTIRREPDGSATVSVALRDRPAVAVIGDMIDGIVVAAGRTGPEAGLTRDVLWRSVAELIDAEIVRALSRLPTGGHAAA